MMEYVLGFVFDELVEQVMLILKGRPDWQVGLLNGVGGKVETGETHRAAMQRECYEESGLNIESGYWKPVGSIRHMNRDSRISIYAAIGVLGDAVTKTDEPIVIVPLDTLPQHMLATSRWLVQAARQAISRSDQMWVEVSFT